MLDLNRKDVVESLLLGRPIRSILLSESDKAVPSGGDKENYYMFYVDNQGSYAGNTADNIAQFAKENIPELSGLTTNAIKSKHMYWATDSGSFDGMYNGDTCVLFVDVNKLPGGLRTDAIKYVGKL